MAEMNRRVFLSLAGLVLVPVRRLFGGRRDKFSFWTRCSAGTCESLDVFRYCYGRVNSQVWRGYPPESVRLECAKYQRLPESSLLTCCFSVDLENRGDGFVRADFNEFDFGPEIPEP